MGTSSASDSSLNIAVEANSKFSFDLYRELSNETKGNLFFSPFSISSALMMCAEGARGETARELGKALGFPERIKKNDPSRPWEISKIHEGISKINELLAGEDSPELRTIRSRIVELRKQHSEISTEFQRINGIWGGKKAKELCEKDKVIVAELNKLLHKVDQYEITVSNALWGEQTYPFREEFKKTIAANYGSGGVIPANFVGAPDTERIRINDWVSKQTNQRINNILPENSIHERTRLVITNSIYFRGQWVEPFLKKRTKPADFFVSPDKSIKVPTMESRNLSTCRYGAINEDGSWFQTPLEYRVNTDPEPLGYPDEGGIQIAEIPYKGDALALVILSPRQKDGLQSIEKMVTATKLNEWLSQLNQREINLFLPKFSTTTSKGLNEALTNLGMKSAFRNPGMDNGADFSGMTSEDSAEKFSISSVYHQATITINEEGTEAAAASSIPLLGAAFKEMVDFTPTFRADRPFLFLIRDKRNGNILFMGRITNPAETT